MTAVIDGVVVTGTPEEISQLIAIHNAEVTSTVGTTIVSGADSRGFQYET